MEGRSQPSGESFVRTVMRGWIVRLGLAGWALALCGVVGQGQERLSDAPVASSWASSRSELELDTQASAAQDIDVSWKKLPERILHDQKEIWLFPVALAHGKYWVPTLAVTAGTAGLIAADPHAMPYFRTHAGNWDDFNDVFDGPITNAETALVPVALFLVGAARHDAYASKTALLAGEAYADGTIMYLALKGLTRRTRPKDIAAGAPFNDTFFNTPKSAFGSSFPSGHAVSAFSIATVVARRYGHHRWVPWVAYGAATLISFSRVTTRAHFPSDVFLGAALGYSIARFEVLRH
jgi:membrane-associated phospholipid phosphatase